jgi:sterol desaturase/sphingolipid hydroxylase (fatty acid hydroxylase superfamily)
MTVLMDHLRAGALPAWALLLAALTLGPMLAGFALERSRLGARRRIFAVPLDDGQLGWEARANLQIVALATLVLAAAVPRGRFAPATAAGALVTFAGMYAWFEAFYYVLHRALHTRALVRFHRQHHRSRVTTPLTGFSMSPVEGLGWLAGYVLPVLVVHGLVFPAWLAYVAYSWAGNVLGHANVELGVRALRGRVALAAHPLIYHALHHARWTGHYALYTSVLDVAFGTTFADWRSLYDRVRAGRPLRALRERGDA